MPYAPRTRNPRKYVRKNSKRTVKPSATFAKKVKAIIHKQTENKETYHEEIAVSFNSGISSTSDMMRVVPNCIQGTGENQRIGNQVRAQRLNIRGHYILSTNNNSIANSRIAVRMFVVSPKNLQGYNDVVSTSAWLGSLLRKGGTNVAFTGVISDLYAPINTDMITCHYDKTQYVTMPYLYYNSSGDAVTSTTPLDMVNATRFFNINLKVKNKMLKYNDQYSTTEPTQYSPILLLGYVHLDNSAPDVVTTQVIASYVSILQYEDS